MKKKIIWLIISILSLFVLVSCSPKSEQKSVADFDDWEQVVAEGTGKTVTIFMWGGNESVNQYMDAYVASELKALYDITLNRVPMNAPEYLTKLINEKKGNVSNGTGDLLWINAENFLTAKTGGLLDGPFTALLPNQMAYYDLDAADLSYDSGIPIEGYEAIWGRAQLVFTYDEKYTANPPKTYAELLNWAQANPGKFTFPKIPEDFVGSAFVRNAYYELTNSEEALASDMDEATFRTFSQPVIDYFKALKPHLWNAGKTFPATQAQQDALFKDGELAMTMGFEVGKTAGQIALGVYDPTVKTYVFDSGTIGNAHYLAVPFNAPETAAALLTIDFLQSPAAQLEKMKADVWGDMPAFDPLRVDEVINDALSEIESVDGGITLESLASKRLPELNAQYIEWIKKIWTDEIINE